MEKIKKAEGNPTPNTFAIILESCEAIGDAKSAVKWVANMEGEWNLFLNPRHLTALVRTHIAAEDMEGASKYLLRLRSYIATSPAQKRKRYNEKASPDISIVFGEVVTGYAKAGRPDRAAEWLQCMIDDDVRNPDGERPPSSLFLRLHAAVVESCLGLQPGAPPNFWDVPMPRNKASERMRYGMDAIRWIEKMMENNLIPPVLSAEERILALGGGAIEQLAGCWLDMMAPRLLGGDGDVDGVKSGHRAVVNAIVYFTKMLSRHRSNVGSASSGPSLHLFLQHHFANAANRRNLDRQGIDMLEGEVFERLPFLPKPTHTTKKSDDDYVSVMGPQEPSDEPVEHVLSPFVERETISTKHHWLEDHSVPAWKRNRQGKARAQSRMSRDASLEKSGNIVFEISADTL